MQDDDVTGKILDAAMMHVPFDGWTDVTFKAAVADADVDPVVAEALLPRRALDLAVAYHKRGDAAMLERLAAADLSGLRYRDKIATAVRYRLEAIDDKEAVRRGATLFSLPHNAPDGARLVWDTCDAIWTALGDTSDDVNWYTKRATLAGVYSSTVLFWLGDDSHDHQATWEFLNRRIDNVMQIEKVKAQVRDNKALSALFAGPNWLASRIRAPRPAPDDIPGRWTPTK